MYAILASMQGGGYGTGVIKKHGPLWTAVAAYLGYVIGVGVFGLPYAIYQTGFFVGIAILFLLSAVLLAVHVLYADVVVATPGKHRLVGYVRAYLGEKWVPWAHWINVGGFWGVLLVYTVMGGSFLHTLLWPVIGGSPLLYQVLFLFVGFLWCLLGVKRIAILEGMLMGVFLIGMAGMLWAGVSHAHLAPFLTFPSFSPLLTYGVVLFSLIADGVIPEMKEVLGKQSRRLREAIVWAVLIITVLYTVFSLLVISVTGAQTSPDTFTGLTQVMGPWVLPIGSSLGFLAVITSFFLCALALYHGWRHDMRLESGSAWLATLGVPLIILLLGSTDTIELMGAVGAIFGGCTAIIILLVYHSAVTRKGKGAIEKKIPGSVSPAWVWVLGAFLAVGVVLECVHLIFSYAV